MSDTSGDRPSLNAATMATSAAGPLLAGSTVKKAASGETCRGNSPTIESPSRFAAAASRTLPSIAHASPVDARTFQVDDAPEGPGGSIKATLIGPSATLMNRSSALLALAANSQSDVGTTSLLELLIGARGSMHEFAHPIRIFGHCIQPDESDTLMLSSSAADAATSDGSIRTVAMVAAVLLATRAPSAVSTAEPIGQGRTSSTMRTVFGGAAFSATRRSTVLSAFVAPPSFRSLSLRNTLSERLNRFACARSSK